MFVLDVSAHTAMLTLSLEDVLKDPSAVLTSTLGFIWRNDWDYEGQGGVKHRERELLPPQGGWKTKAADLIENHGGALQTLFDETSLILQATASSARGNNSFDKAIQGAFASEMHRSSDLTAWPCPSFWEGVDNGVGNDATIILQHISGEMVPNCSEDDPFVRCTVNKDRCEVNRDAKCK